MLEGLQVLRAAAARLEARPVPRRPVANQLHVGLGLLDLALHVGQSGPRVDQLRVERSGLVLQGRDLAVLGQVRRGVVDLVETGVDGLEIQQRELSDRVGFQLALPGERAALAPTTKVQGSVRRVET